MKQAILLFTVFLAQTVLSHMPTVYEFCSHVVSRGEGDRLVCDASRCQGRPGKIGPAGPQGFQGLKGQKGEQGTTEGLEGRLQILEDFYGKLGTLLEDERLRGSLCYMGMKNRGIPDSAISASSKYDNNHAGRLARLDNVPSGGTIGAWAAKHRQVGEWIQVDFGKPKLVAGLVSQGRPVFHGMQWVTSYKVSCGIGVSNLSWITENGAQKVFTGNSDRDTKVVNKFPSPATCRYIRVYPQTWNGWVSMRLEFIHGVCYDSY